MNFTSQACFATPASICLFLRIKESNKNRAQLGMRSLLHVIISEFTIFMVAGSVNSVSNNLSDLLRLAQLGIDTAFLHVYFKQWGGGLVGLKHPLLVWHPFCSVIFNFLK